MGERSATIDRDAPSSEVFDSGLRSARAEDIGRLKEVMALEGSALLCPSTPSGVQR